MYVSLCVVFMCECVRVLVCVLCVSTCLRMSVCVCVCCVYTHVCVGVFSPTSFGGELAVASTVTVTCL